MMYNVFDDISGGNKMDENVKKITLAQLERTAEALRKNNMAAYVCNDSSEAVEIVKGLLCEGATIGSGGSMSLVESGVMELLKSGNYNFIDRTQYSPENISECYAKMYTADYYFCSSNAVTENGELYNVDGNSNRISAICFGPKKVIMVVGCNKIVRNLDDAVKRVKSVAAPANCVRLGCNTYCKETGVCMGIDGCMTDGCKGDTICCNYLISAKQRHKDRINVILVAEPLGY